MIAFREVTLVLKREGQVTEVLRDVSALMEARDRTVILGAAGSGKSCLVRVLSGQERPTAGQVDRYGRVSYPVGFSGGFRPKLSLSANITFTAKAYGADPDEVLDFVARVAELGKELSEPTLKCDREVRLRTAYALSYAIPFDTYLIDNNVGVGTPDFRKRCEVLLALRARSSGYILTTRNPAVATKWGAKIWVLDQGKLTYYPDKAEAFDAFEVASQRRSEETEA